MASLARYESTGDPVEAMRDFAPGSAEWTLKLNRLLQSIYEQGRRDERKLVEMGHYDEVLSRPVRDARLPEFEDLERVIRHIVGVRTETFVIKLEQLARVCDRAGLFQELPDLERSGLVELWRDTLRSAFCGSGWKANRRRWMVTCQGDGDFWVRRWNRG
jgi:hypothetical protein